MPTYTQDNRLVGVDSPLGKDVLLLTGFSGHERISRLFEFHLDFLSTKTSINPGDIVGKKISWFVRREDGSERYFSGHVRRFASHGRSDRLNSYSAEVVPWLWFLTQTADLRIFQKKTVGQIIEQVFKDLGFSDYSLSIKGTQRQFEYCVQYRESDFDFVSRLMEQEGIFYFFEHSNGKHNLVLANSKDGYKGAGDAKVRYASNTSEPDPTDNLRSWEHSHEYRSGKFAHTDYNFETPSTSLMTKNSSIVKTPGVDKFEVYDYPGLYPKKPEGETLSKVRMEEIEAPYDVVTGASHCRTFSPGFKFAVEEHHTESEKGKGYVLTSVEHSARIDSSAYLTGGEGREQNYLNSFTCIPDSVTFRPEQTTGKPTIDGIQTAVVVGASGQELEVDKYGRVKVQFHWDREGKKDSNSSCWIRVAQPVAGKRWGSSFWPRIGQEVVVSFEEGDPDRPIITGCLYNAEQMPPYLGDGPDGKHPSDPKVSGFKTNTTQGGVGFNELRFDDTKDKQQVFVHAERNMDTRVKNDSFTSIVNNAHLTVGSEKDKTGDLLERVYRDHHVNIKRDQVHHVEGKYLLTVGKGEGGGGTYDLLVEKDKKETVEANSHLHVKQNHNQKVDQGLSITVGGDEQHKVGPKFAVESAQAVHIKAGMTVVIEAGVQLTLKVGGNFVDISPAGVAISGTLVMINSGGAAGSGPGSSPTAPADAAQASPTVPTVADDAKTGSKSAPG